VPINDADLIKRDPGRKLYGPQGQVLIDLDTRSLTGMKLLDAAGNLIADLSQTNPVWTVEAIALPSITPATAAGTISQQNNQLYVGNGSSAVPVGSNSLTSPLTYALGG